MAVKPRDVHLFFRKTATFVKYKEIKYMTSHVLH